MITARTLDAADNLAIRQAILRGSQTCGLNPLAVYLHGSRATQWQREESDWDFAILGEAQLTWEQRQCFLLALSNALRGALVDMADLHQCDTVFAAHVVTEGQAVYVSQELARQRFEMLTLSKYARLNEDRRDLLDDIRQRGTVFLAAGAA